MCRYQFSKHRKVIRRPKFRYMEWALIGYAVVHLEAAVVVDEGRRIAVKAEFRSFGPVAASRVTGSVEGTRAAGRPINIGPLSSKTVGA